MSRPGDRLAKYFIALGLWRAGQSVNQRAKELPCPKREAREARYGNCKLLNENCELQIVKPRAAWALNLQFSIHNFQLAISPNRRRLNARMKLCLASIQRIHHRLPRFPVGVGARSRFAKLWS